MLVYLCITLKSGIQYSLVKLGKLDRIFTVKEITPMFKCVFCGLDNLSEKARFCIECGHDGAAKDWTPEDIDQPAKVSQYVSILSEFYFDAQTGAAVE